MLICFCCDIVVVLFCLFICLFVLFPVRYLDIEDEKIDQARQDGIGIPETVYQLLLQWKQDTGEKATVSKMFRAMEKSNLKKLWTCLKQDSGDEEL